jgi:hypothetical protein
MASHERFIEEMSDVVRGLFSDSMRESKRRKKKWVKLAKVIAALILSAIVLPIVLITAGFFLGPKGTEGLIITPLAVITAWAAILFFAYRKPRTPRMIAKSDLPQLPARTEEWIEFQRSTLPWAAQQKLDTISLKLEALTPQLRALDPQAPPAIEARRLLGDELPELVRGYQKVPATLQKQPLHGGASPERRLIDGLATIDEEITRLHERLAAEDLKALATQQRYLEIKYKRDKMEE